MENIESILLNGVHTVQVENSEEGVGVAANILYSFCNNKTALFLSGGKTPKSLYQHLANEGKLKAGAVGMIDERFGVPMHDASNEKMIRETNFLRYLAMRDISFYPILGLHPPGGKQVAENYDQVFRMLIYQLLKSIGILGVGVDGHTAVLPAGVQNSKVKIQKDGRMVIEINNFPGECKKRITLTFNALALMDLLLVLVFGKEKKQAFEKMFQKGPIEDIPARFFTQPDIAKKTILITDQRL